MQVIKAKVLNGRIVLDEPTTLPEGHEVELRVANDDGLGEDARRELHDAIVRGIHDGRAGDDVEMNEFLDQLDAEP